MFRDICKQFIEDIGKIHIAGSITLTILNFVHQIELIDEQNNQDLIQEIIELTKLELDAIHGTNEQTSNLKEACSLVHEFLLSNSGDRQELINQITDIKQRY